MLKDLAEIATFLDGKGFHREATILDNVLVRVAKLPDVDDFIGQKSDDVEDYNKKCRQFLSEKGYSDEDITKLDDKLQLLPMAHELGMKPS